MLRDVPARHLKLVTVHAYALTACSGATHLAAQESFTRAAIQGLADSVHGEVEAAAAHGKPLRVREINGDLRKGAPRVSNSWSQLLWVLNVRWRVSGPAFRGSTSRGAKQTPAAIVNS